jgi:hypothetical protein
MTHHPVRSPCRLSGALLIAVALTALTVPASVPAAASPALRTRLLVSGLHGSVGSTVGPDGALYVAEAVAGRVSRIDTRSGRRTTVVSGLPKRVLDTGGAMDVAFLGGRAYVLVTLVSPDVGGADVDGIYRVDGPDSLTVVADIGTWSAAHPPATPFFVPTGVQFALQSYRGGLLVTDGHHNRLLRVTPDGAVSELAAFSNVVPTGLATAGGRVYLAQAGPVPHAPTAGRVVRIDPRSGRTVGVASGAPLMVDVEIGPRRQIYALSQGHFTPGNPEGSAADPGTGALARVGRDGALTTVVGGLDRPTSLEFVHGTAYVVTLAGEVWTIACPER